MDWNSANVSLDQEALKAAQAAGNQGIHIPVWIIVLFVIVGVVVAFSVVKKAKEGGDGKDSGDNKSGSDS